MRTKSLMSTGIIRLIIIILVAILPVNFLILLLANLVISNVEQQIFLEKQGVMDSYMTQIDNSMSRMSVQLNRLSREDKDYLWLRDKQLNNETDYYQQLQSVVDLRNTIEDKLSENINIDGVFIIFPEKDIVIQGGNIGEKATLVRERMLEMTENNDNFSQSWHLEIIQGEGFMLRLQKYKNTYYGAWISAKHLMDELHPQSLEDSCLLINDSGAVVYSETTSLEDIDLEKNALTYQGVNYILVKSASSQSDLIFIQMLSKSQIDHLLPILIRILFVLAALSVLVIPTIILAMRKLIIRPVNRLTVAMNRIEEGEVKYRITKGNGGYEFEQINQHFNHMMDELDELRIGYYEEKLKNQKIRLRFLSQQIQPHFILNTLNILYSYEQDEYPAIQKMILHLSKYFRYVVKANSDYVPLKQEVDHVRNYFAIQEERFHRTFEAFVNYDEDLGDCLILPLMLQTFAENAIKHALIPKQIITICIDISKKTEEEMQICISDTGIGMSEDVRGKIEKFIETGEYQHDLGVGIQNIIDRMNILYKGKGQLQIQPNEPHGTCIIITIPIIKKGFE